LRALPSALEKELREIKEAFPEIIQKYRKYEVKQTVLENEDINMENINDNHIKMII